jgi:molybdopterin/thiamine biosynthesis adenylyltransferase
MVGIMKKISYSRQMALFDPEDYEDEGIEIIGAGAIGSFTALILSKMGVKYIKVWDFDKVEKYNIPNQFFPIQSIGMKKVEALTAIVHDFSDVFLEHRASRFQGTFSGSIVIAAVDNMDTRKSLFEKAKSDKYIKYFIDARMGGEVMRIYTVDMHNQKAIEIYAKTLYSHKEADKLPCAARSIIYCVTVASGLVANQVKHVLTKGKYQSGVIFDLKSMTLLMDGELCQS